MTQSTLKYMTYIYDTINSEIYDIYDTINSDTDEQSNGDAKTPRENCK